MSTSESVLGMEMSDSPRLDALGATSRPILPQLSSEETSLAVTQRCEDSHRASKSGDDGVIEAGRPPHTASFQSPLSADAIVGTPTTSVRGATEQDVQHDVNACGPQKAQPTVVKEVPVSDGGDEYTTEFHSNDNENPNNDTSGNSHTNRLNDSVLSPLVPVDEAVGFAGGPGSSLNLASHGGGSAGAEARGGSPSSPPPLTSSTIVDDETDKEEGLEKGEGEGDESKRTHHRALPQARYPRNASFHDHPQRRGSVRSLSLSVSVDAAATAAAFAPQSSPRGEGATPRSNGDVSGSGSNLPHPLYVPQCVHGANGMTVNVNVGRSGRVRSAVSNSNSALSLNGAATGTPSAAPVAGASAVRRSSTSAIGALALQQVSSSGGGGGGGAGGGGRVFVSPAAATVPLVVGLPVHHTDSASHRNSQSSSPRGMRGSASDALGSSYRSRGGGRRGRDEDDVALGLSAREEEAVADGDENDDDEDCVETHSLRSSSPVGTPHWRRHNPYIGNMQATATTMTTTTATSASTEARVRSSLDTQAFTHSPHTTSTRSVTTARDASSVAHTRGSAVAMAAAAVKGRGDDNEDSVLAASAAPATADAAQQTTHEAVKDQSTAEANPNGHAPYPSTASPPLQPHAMAAPAATHTGNARRVCSSSTTTASPPPLMAAPVPSADHRHVHHHPSGSTTTLNNPVAPIITTDPHYYPNDVATHATGDHATYAAYNENGPTTVQLHGTDEAVVDPMLAPLHREEYVEDEQDGADGANAHAEPNGDDRDDDDDDSERAVPGGGGLRLRHTGWQDDGEDDVLGGDEERDEPPPGSLDKHQGTSPTTRTVRVHHRMSGSVLARSGAAAPVTTPGGSALEPVTPRSSTGSLPLNAHQPFHRHHYRGAAVPGLSVAAAPASQAQNSLSSLSFSVHHHQMMVMNMPTSASLSALHLQNSGSTYSGGGSPSYAPVPGGRRAMQPAHPVVPMAPAKTLHNFYEPQHPFRLSSAQTRSLEVDEGNEMPMMDGADCTDANVAAAGGGPAVGGHQNGAHPLSPSHLNTPQPSVRAASLSQGPQPVPLPNHQHHALSSVGTGNSGGVATNVRPISFPAAGSVIAGEMEGGPLTSSGEAMGVGAMTTMGNAGTSSSSSGGRFGGGGVAGGTGAGATVGRSNFSGTALSSSLGQLYPVGYSSSGRNLSTGAAHHNNAASGAGGGALRHANVGGSSHPLSMMVPASSSSEQGGAAMTTMSSGGVNSSTGVGSGMMAMPSYNMDRLLYDVEVRGRYPDDADEDEFDVDGPQDGGCSPGMAVTSSLMTVMEAHRRQQQLQRGGMYGPSPSSHTSPRCPPNGVEGGDNAAYASPDHQSYHQTQLQQQEQPAYQPPNGPSFQPVSPPFHGVDEMARADYGGHYDGATHPHSQASPNAQESAQPPYHTNAAQAFYQDPGSAYGSPNPNPQQRQSHQQQQQPHQPNPSAGPPHLVTFPPSEPALMAAQYGGDGYGNDDPGAAPASRFPNPAQGGYPPENTPSSTVAAAAAAANAPPQTLPSPSSFAPSYGYDRAGGGGGGGQHVDPTMPPDAYHAARPRSLQPEALASGGGGGAGGGFQGSPNSFSLRSWNGPGGNGEGGGGGGAGDRYSTPRRTAAAAAGGGGAAGGADYYHYQTTGGYYYDAFTSNDGEGSGLIPSGAMMMMDEMSQGRTGGVNEAISPHGSAGHGIFNSMRLDGNSVPTSPYEGHHTHHATSQAASLSASHVAGREGVHRGDTAYANATTTAAGGGGGHPSAPSPSSALPPPAYSPPQYASQTGTAVGDSATTEARSAGAPPLPRFASPPTGLLPPPADGAPAMHNPPPPPSSSSPPGYETHGFAPNAEVDVAFTQGPGAHGTAGFGLAGPAYPPPHGEHQERGEATASAMYADPANAAAGTMPFAAGCDTSQVMNGGSPSNGMAGSPSAFTSAVDASTAATPMTVEAGTGGMTGSGGDPSGMNVATTSGKGLESMARPEVLQRLLQSAGGEDVEVLCPNTWSFSLYSSDDAKHAIVPSGVVAITKGAIHYVELSLRHREHLRFRFQWCQRYLEGKCTEGAGCQFVHAREIANITTVHHNENTVTVSQPGPHDVAELIGGRNTRQYITMPPGENFCVYPPNHSQNPPQFVPSQRILRTVGADNVYRILCKNAGSAAAGGGDGTGDDDADVRNLRPRHCAHFQFKKMCNLGETCSFIHSLVPYIQRLKPAELMEQRRLVLASIAEEEKAAAAAALARSRAADVGPEMNKNGGPRGVFQTGALARATPSAPQGNTPPMPSSGAIGINGAPSYGIGFTNAQPPPPPQQQPDPMSVRPSAVAVNVAGPVAPGGARRYAYDGQGGGSGGSAVGADMNRPAVQGFANDVSPATSTTTWQSGAPPQTFQLPGVPAQREVGGAGVGQGPSAPPRVSPSGPYVATLNGVGTAHPQPPPTTAFTTSYNSYMSTTSMPSALRASPGQQQQTALPYGAVDASAYRAPLTSSPSAPQVMPASAQLYANPNGSPTSPGAVFVQAQGGPHAPQAYASTVAPMADYRAPPRPSYPPQQQQQQQQPQSTQRIVSANEAYYGSVPDYTVGRPMTLFHGQSYATTAPAVAPVAAQFSSMSPNASYTSMPPSHEAHVPYQQNMHYGGAPPHAPSHQPMPPHVQPTTASANGATFAAVNGYGPGYGNVASHAQQQQQQQQQQNQQPAPPSSVHYAAPSFQQSPPPFVHPTLPQQLGPAHGGALPSAPAPQGVCMAPRTTVGVGAQSLYASASPMVQRAPHAPSAPADGVDRAVRTPAPSSSSSHGGPSDTTAAAAGTGVSANGPPIGNRRGGEGRSHRAVEGGGDHLLSGPHEAQRRGPHHHGDTSDAPREREPVPSAAAFSTAATAAPTASSGGSQQLSSASFSTRFSTVGGNSESGSQRQK